MLTVVSDLIDRPHPVGKPRVPINHEAIYLRGSEDPSLFRRFQIVWRDDNEGAGLVTLGAISPNDCSIVDEKSINNADTRVPSDCGTRELSFSQTIKL